MLRPARAFANRWAVLSVPLVIGLQLLAVYFEPLARVLRTVPLTAGEWLVVGALSVIPAIIGQLIEVAQGRQRTAPI